MAAVVEYYKVPEDGDTLTQLNLRVSQFVAYIRNTLAMEADIIVFPEGALNNHQFPQWVPNVTDRIVPCGHISYAGNPIEQISCAAQGTKKYVVINLIMKTNCTAENLLENVNRSCPANDLLLYSTNVVFDRAGLVVSL